MLPIIFINCAAAPFIDDIIDGRKTYETRTRDTLRYMLPGAVNDLTHKPIT